MINKIIDLIKQGENISVEFKKCSMSVSSSVYETVCSFLNRYGGDILLGVLDSGEIAGVAPENVSSIEERFCKYNKQFAKAYSYLLRNSYGLCDRW